MTGFECGRCNWKNEDEDNFVMNSEYERLCRDCVEELEEENEDDD